MGRKISKTNSDLAFFNSRLDELRISSHERLRAKAHMARAEAVADAISALIGAIKRVLKGPGVRAQRRSAHSAG